MSPVIDAELECPDVAAVHVVPESDTVPSSGRLEDFADEKGLVPPLTHRAVHVHIVTWMEKSKCLTSFPFKSVI